MAMKTITNPATWPTVQIPPISVVSLMGRPRTPIVRKDRADIIAALADGLNAAGVAHPKFVRWDYSDALGWLLDQIREASESERADGGQSRR